jgi:hypothetical protein
MYRLDRMRKQYEQFTAAEGYAIGFHYGENVYCAMLDKIPRRYTRLQRESKSNGGGYGLYIKINEPKFIKELLPKAFYVCKLNDLIDSEGHLNDKGERKYFNKGVMFEKAIYEINGQQFRGKDSVRFYQSGDITINGKEIQVKYEWARICYDRTLRNLTK